MGTGNHTGSKQHRRDHQPGQHQRAGLVHDPRTVALASHGEEQLRGEVAPSTFNQRRRYNRDLKEPSMKHATNHVVVGNQVITHSSPRKRFQGRDWPTRFLSAVLVALLLPSAVLASSLPGPWGA